MSSLLMTTIFAPLVGALAIVLRPGASREAVRQIALAATLITLALTAILLCNYAPSDKPFAAWSLPWLGETSGIDI